MRSVGSCYSRSTGVTWRDTGRRVVILPRDSTEVQVLGGGAASVWRALDQPGDIVDVLSRLQWQETGAEVRHDDNDVVACLNDLVAVGIVQERS